MERYALIRTHMPREFVLLQGTGCRWKQCTFCDYHTDTSENPYATNAPGLEKVTGEMGVLDIINSGSGIELDEATLEHISRVVREKQIHTVWFEMHYMYRHRLADFARRFAPATVKFRCGVETFSPTLRREWKKGIPESVTAVDVARYFQGVCLLCGTEGDSRERILSDIETARRHFEYFSINFFCNNTTAVKADAKLARWFATEIAPTLAHEPGIEILMNNTDLGVGD